MSLCHRSSSSTHNEVQMSVDVAGCGAVLQCAGAHHESVNADSDSTISRSAGEGTRRKEQEGKRKEEAGTREKEESGRDRSQEEQLRTMENSAGVDREGASEHDGVMFWNITCRSNADERNSTICYETQHAEQQFHHVHGRKICSGRD